MEMFVHRGSERIDVSMARFANVAFSDGSLLHGFNQRLEKKQPIVAPTDIKRYFVTPKEGAELCLMSTFFGENRDIFFPKPSEELRLTTFSEIAVSYLAERNLKPHICKTEDEARAFAMELEGSDTWPCLFSKSDTTGEKDFEEFFTEKETLDMESFVNVGVIKNKIEFNPEALLRFEEEIAILRNRKQWNKDNLVELFHQLIPDFGHLEKGKFLNGKM